VKRRGNERGTKKSKENRKKEIRRHDDGKIKVAMVFGIISFNFLPLYFPLSLQYSYA